ncbi:hypothetical protein, partial [uncultured Halomonas sp.]|uniref:hypothetical protein n=1 Tax=uncultured Halomonas sp. TaxID=173971 RepID=UPI00262F6CF1
YQELMTAAEKAEAERQRAASKKVDNGGKPDRDAMPAGDSDLPRDDGNTDTDTPPGEVRERAPVAAPKPVANVSVSQVLSRTHEGVYLESQQEVDEFIDALKRELDDAIQANKRIRLR